jgi:predicted RND superfamily exporter protein
MASSLDDHVTAVGRWTIRWRWAVVLATVIVVCCVAAGARRLSFKSDYRAYFSEGNPYLRAFEALQKIYTKDDNVIFVIQPPSGDVFSPRVLEALQDITREAWKLPHSLRVDSLTNFQHIRATGDDIFVGDFIAQNSDWSAEELAERRAVALAEPFLVRRILSPDARTTGVNVTIHLPEKNDRELPETVAAARALKAQMREKYPELHLGLSGTAIMSKAFSEAGLRDLGTLTPIMYALLALTMLFFLRSVSCTLMALAVVGLAAAAAMGWAGWMGIKLTPLSAVAPTIIMTISIADAIHLLVILLRERRRGRNTDEAIVESLRVNFQPVFLTSLTTAIGFLCLNFSDSPPYHDLGNITAVGVFAAWVCSVFFLPAVVSIVGVRLRARGGERRMAIDRFAEWVIAHRRGLLRGLPVVIVGLALAIPRIELNDEFVEYFDPRISFRVDTDFMREHLTGIHRLQFSLEAGEPAGISDPGYQAAVEEFAAWMRTRPGVVHVNTYTDIMKRLNRSMHGDDEAWYKLPENRALAAQYLLLYEMSLPYGLDLNHQINVDKSSTRLVVTMEATSSRDIRALKLEAEQWLQGNAPASMQTEGTSPSVMFAYIAERNIRSMVTGTTVGVLLISLTLILALRNIKLGLLSLVPNLVPPSMAFGVWGIFVGEAGLAISVVAMTGLGIIVDDTVHFLSKFVRARRERGADAVEAVRYAFATVGAALAITSAILIAGFSVLAFATFWLTATMGLLTSLTIAAALVTDFLLLPPLLIALDREEHARVFGRAA